MKGTKWQQLAEQILLYRINLQNQAYLTALREIRLFVNDRALKTKTEKKIE